MAFNSRSINFKAGLDTRGVATGVQQIQGHMGKLSKDVNRIKRSFGGLGTAIVGAFALDKITGFAKTTVNAASDLNETIGKTQQIFGNTSYEIENFAKVASSSLGLSQRAAMDGASTFAVFGKAAGLTGSELTKFSTDLVKLSSDLASFYNTSPEEAIVAIGAALRGESEPIRRYGVLLNDATLKQIAFDNGITTSIKEALTPQKKALAANLAIFQQTTDAQGDFARTSDGLANLTRVLNAELENSKAILGQELLPMLTEFVKKVTPALSEMMKYGRAAFGTMSSSDIRKLEEDEKANAAKESTISLQKQLNDEQKLYNELVKSQSFVITNEEYRDRIRFKAKFNALRQEYDMRVRIANESINEAISKVGGTTAPTPTEDPLSLEEQISIAKKSNKALSELESQGLSKAQVKALDTAFAINVMNDNLSQIPETLATIDSGLTGKPPLSEFQKGIEEMTENVRSMLEGLVTTIAVDFFGAIGEAMVMGSDSFKSFGQQTLEAMGRFFKQIGAMFISYGIAALEFFKTLLVPANAPALIAAGVALSLIGGAISGAAKSMAQTGQPSGAGVPAQSGGMGYNFETRIDGYDLVLVNDRNQRLRNRRG